MYACDARLVDEVAGLVDESVRLNFFPPATQRTTPSGTNLPPSTLLVGCTSEALLLRQRLVRDLTMSFTSRTSHESEGSARRANRTSGVSEDAARSVGAACDAVMRQPGQLRVRRRIAQTRALHVTLSRANRASREPEDATVA